MNYYGKTPLEMDCPNCGGYGAHPVVRTEPKCYHWGSDTVELFKRIAGRDISYRRRVKKCVNCNGQFITVEMGNIFLRGLVKEVQRLEQKLANSLAVAHVLKEENIQLQAERKATFAAIRKSSKLLNRQLPERRSRKPV